MRALLLKLLLMPLAMPPLLRVMPLLPLAMLLWTRRRRRLTALLLLKHPLKRRSSNRLLMTNGSVWGRSFPSSLRDEGH